MSVAISVLVNEALPELTGCPYPLIEAKVKEALQSFCEGTDAFNSGFRKNVLSTDPTSPNGQITIATPAALAEYEPSEILTLRIDGVSYSTKRRVITEDLTNIDDIVGKRTKFWYPATAASIIMYPFDPVAVQLSLQVAFKPLMTVTAIDDIFYQDWHTAIVRGAKGSLMAMAGKPWSNAQRASYCLGQFEAAKNSAIIAVYNNLDREGDRRTNGFM